MLALILTRKLRPIAIGSALGVVDVVGDDGAAAGDLVADEFGGDVIGDAAPKSWPSRRLR
jgi:hypothetical protein